MYSNNWYQLVSNSTYTSLHQLEMSNIINKTTMIYMFLR